LLVVFSLLEPYPQQCKPPPNLPLPLQYRHHHCHRHPFWRSEHHYHYDSYHDSYHDSGAQVAVVSMFGGIIMGRRYVVLSKKQSQAEAQSYSKTMQVRLPVLVKDGKVQAQQQEQQQQQAYFLLEEGMMICI
jgi:hypothetical protein